MENNFETLRIPPPPRFPFPRWVAAGKVLGDKADREEMEYTEENSEMKVH